MWTTICKLLFLLTENRKVKQVMVKEMLRQHIKNPPKDSAFASWRSFFPFPQHRFDFFRFQIFLRAIRCGYSDP